MSKPLIIPIFLPNAGCPHRCSFCDQKAITGHGNSIPSASDLRTTIDTFLEYQHGQRDTTQISFYGGNFLGLKPGDLTFLLREATRYIDTGSVNSIRFSTRPDTIHSKQLDLLTDYPVSTIELGVQSMDNRVLAGVNRGHTAEDTERAVELLKGRNYTIGLQMMVGLPGDSDAGARETAARIAALSPDFVRIYPTVVLANSPLADRFKKGDYTPMSLASALTLVKNLYRLFNQHDIRVVRMGLQISTALDSPSTMLAGPYHPAFGHLVLSELFLDKASTALARAEISPGKIALKVHPQNLSRVRGLKSRNIDILKKRYHLHTLEIRPDISLAKDDVVVEQF